MSPHQVEKHVSYELLFKALLFAVVKMASFPGCMTFIPHNPGSWGEKRQQSCHQMETCTQWRKQPAGTSWKSTIQCWVLHMGRQNMQKYRPQTYRIYWVQHSQQVEWNDSLFYSEIQWSSTVKLGLFSLKKRMFLGESPNESQYFWRDNW